MLLFDPTVKEMRPICNEDCDWKRVERESLAIQQKAIAEGKDSVCVVHRPTGQVRWFTLSPRYQGALGHAEALLRGQWRYASPAEEKAELERIREEKAAADEQQKARLQLAQAQTLLSSIHAAQAMEANTKKESK